ncbi:hypothetical protein [Rhodococcoides kyotonense]|uniref:Uncharacterized protein n=1 Tax=Rhodococcoides kyotonense TaxID=398843 RepID=A0A239E6Y9_9NOCA|nr:hypothetical protein [Rhodococcus kyotonensis]SNS40201.1 hypothetical protein SAMN05421642_102222 [Rhodococcus kyotonensis]
MAAYTNRTEIAGLRAATGGPITALTRDLLDDNTPTVEFNISLFAQADTEKTAWFHQSDNHGELVHQWSLTPDRAHDLAIELLLQVTRAREIQQVEQAKGIDVTLPDAYVVEVDHADLLEVE